MDEINIKILEKKIYIPEILHNIQKFIHNQKRYYFYEGDEFNIAEFKKENKLFHNDLLTYISNNQYGIIQYIYDENQDYFHIIDDFMT